MPNLRSSALSVMVAFLVAACSNGSGGGGGDDTGRAQMASDLVTCKNEKSALKEKIGELTLELQKAKAAADSTVHLDAIDIRAQHEAAPVKHVEGNIAPEQLTKVIKANSAGLRTCYEKGLKRNPNLQYVSTVNVRFSVKNTGAAFDVGFSPHSDGEMEKCMAAAIARWQFPAFTGDPVQVESPVNLVAK